ncbi:MAG: ABC transporter permease subunit [Lentisphaerae bacterium]|nr:ABC transporter permease subunit [Lentisphaerota bacterium]
MGRFFNIWMRELGICFLSPIAYVTMVIYLGLSGWAFMQGVERNVGSDEPLQILLLASLFFLLPILVAVITMRLFAEEKKSGTIETLMTAPVTEAEIVLGKYAGAIGFLIIVIAPGVASLFLLALLSPAIGITDIDMGALAAVCAILLLVSALFVAVGLVVSLLSKNQIVAAMAGICVNGIILAIGYMESLLPMHAGKFISYMSIENHLLDFGRGSIDTRPVIFYASTTIFMLFTAIRLLGLRRWR